MHVKKMSALALVVAAAGLTLTACGGSDGSSASAHTGASETASSSTGGQGSASDNSSSSSDSAASSSSGASADSSPGSSSGSSSGSSTGSGKNGELGAQTSSAKSGAMCKTDNLALSASATGVKNQVVVNLKNTGSDKCSMHGFPGVELVGPDGLGDTGPEAARTDVPAATATIGPGEETRFLLHYIPDNSGSGKTYTRLSVTPPNEKVSEIVNLDALTITVAAPSGHAPDVYVDPIGYHVGSGK
ncbi:DUF4232 domain-containing protein [Streptomyces sp. RKAG290]|uniref:DUF4232 domain-containing protein n=1 Tax=Streptomyces sp. RKAG290 TaxID=2888348 RepID=UPI002034A6A9|nr:DUF4232 domain-containing protein [Streptomyces sp. RKAG290]MCM2413529.1 DUF4232 domain-containing protein [Streptomyces sp. RKAG290]